MNGFHNKKPMKYLLFLITLPLFFSCSEEPSFVEDTTIPFPGVDQRLWPYFERFEEEASLRELSINLANLRIEGRIEAINEEHIAGTCQFRGNQPRLVTVDAGFWNRAGDLFKEFIVFHELGHCVLERDHDESESPSGVCLSIMRSGTTDCIDRYAYETRSYYLNELFSKMGGI